MIRGGVWIRGWEERLLHGVLGLHIHMANDNDSLVACR
jgi:hypothetical protein